MIDDLMACNGGLLLLGAIIAIAAIAIRLFKR